MLRSRINYFSLIIFLFMILLLPSKVFAKGGSLKGLGKLFGGSDLIINDTIILIIIVGVTIVLVVVAFIVWRLYKKNRDAKVLAGEIEKYDDAWNLRELEKHVRETFYEIYGARTEHNQSIAGNYTTPSLYNTYKAQTDTLLARNHRHALKRVYLDKIKIMGINDYKDDNKDSFWAYIKGSAFDYHTNDFSRIITESSSESNHFREMWKFVRTPQGWVLDRRDPYVIWSLLKAESFTEGYEENLSNGYLFCGNCEGYYVLEDGESPENFDVCQCGGSLRYYDDFDGLFKENKKI